VTRAAMAESPVKAGLKKALGVYLKQSEGPLQSLVFVLPLVVIYEFGWRLGKPGVLAFSLIHRFFVFFGATSTFLPALLLVAILLTWHIASRGPWVVHWKALAGMCLESVLLALPLVALEVGESRWQPWPLYVAGKGLGANQIVIAMGAGIYEELIFRLIAMTLLHMLFVDMLKLSRIRSGVLMVVISAVMFSLYHYLGSEVFSWKTCLFRTVAGIYFGTIFICRGFGVTAGCHAAYDVMIRALVPF
jgi:membrane protease YdiL (CAAX protease family)